MELMQEVKDYSHEELEEEEDEEINTRTTKEEEESNSKQQLQHCPFSPSPSNFSLSSSSPSTTHHHNHNQNQWLGINHSPESHNSSSRGLGFLHQDTTTSNFTNQTNLKQIDFMELSLGTNKDPSSSNTNNNNQQQEQQEHQQQQQPSTHEKEHMFDKVVTPSDVGKLNRLVIPKQHAEKYFPLDSNSNEKGLLLNFEDRNGKLWRFRYSYWNSSQSYVMTKGWSRFVKDKKLDAGDIVSFQRGVGELFRHRLFIDWRRRTNHNLDPSSSTLFTPFFLPNQQQYSIRWGGGANSRFYSLPYPSPPQSLQQHHHHQQQNHHQNHHDPMSYNYQMYPFHQHGGGNVGNVNHQYNFHHQQHDPSSVFYMRSSASSSMVDQGSLTRHQQGGVGRGNASNMIIDSVPVSHHHQHYHHQHQHGGFSSSGNLTSTTTTTSNSGAINGAGKRLRLFGVNMECGSSTNHDTIPSSSTSIVPSLQHLRLPHHEETSTRFEEDKRREASMIFGLDPSLQYHNYQQQ